MNDTVGGAFLDAFNARNANAVEVARSFVYSNHLELIAGDWHAILIGPRGSGKTTLLKMLQVNALRSWRGPEAEQLAGSVRNVGIYVPADVAWSAQLESIADGKPVSEASVRLIRHAAFATHLLHAVLRAIEDRLSPPADAVRPELFRLSITPEQEAQLVEVMATAWQINPKLQTLRSVRMALIERHAIVAKEAERLRMGLVDAAATGLVERNAFFELDPVQALLAVIHEVNHLSQNPGQRWAVLFDELEILPASVQKKIFRLLRSTDQILLFKLAISPHTPEWAAVLAEVHGPRGDGDYKEVSLWYTDRASMYEFGQRLLDKQVASADLPVTTAEAFLGRSQVFTLEEDRQLRQEGYRPGGRWPSTFASLSAKDASFRAFLLRKGIDANDLDASDGSRVGPLVRKIAPIVALRDFDLRREQAGAQKTRSRKITPYTGVDALVAATEGNPRWIIALAKSLIAKAKGRESFPVPDREQSDEVLKVSQRFEAMLRSAPVGDIAELPPRTGVWELLEKIGQSARHEVLEGSFKEDPACSWTVDDVPLWQESLLKLALNLGGIVYLSDGESSVALDSLKGHKFRLSFLLAPKFALPLRKTKAITLSKMLTESSRDLFELSGGKANGED